MKIFSYAIYYILGFVIGMFLYTFIHKIPREEKIFSKPLIIYNKYNYIFSVIVGFLFLGVFLKYNTFSAIKYATLISSLIVIGIIDYKTTDVYFKTTFLSIVLGLFFIAIGIYFKIAPGEYIISGVIGGGLIAIIHILTKGGIGGGDAEVFLICGLFLGFKLTILVTIIAFILAATSGLFLILIRKRSFKDSMPFIPFITAASIFIIMLI